jgi:hypothetical protein
MRARSEAKVAVSSDVSCPAAAFAVLEGFRCIPLRESEVYSEMNGTSTFIFDTYKSHAMKGGCAMRMRLDLHLTC